MLIGVEFILHVSLLYIKTGLIVELKILTLILVDSMDESIILIVFKLFLFIKRCPIWLGKDWDTFLFIDMAG